MPQAHVAQIVLLSGGDGFQQHVPKCSNLPKKDQNVSGFRRKHLKTKRSFGKPGVPAPGRSHLGHRFQGWLLPPRHTWACHGRGTKGPKHSIGPDSLTLSMPGKVYIMGPEMIPLQFGGSKPMACCWWTLYFFWDLWMFIPFHPQISGNMWKNISFDHPTKALTPSDSFQGPRTQRGFFDPCGRPLSSAGLQAPHLVDEKRLSHLKRQYLNFPFIYIISYI